MATTMVDRNLLITVAVGAGLLGLLGYLLHLLVGIALHDGFTSVANDAANYLVMARHYSPWQAESAAVAAAWPQQDFPPAFPLLLAATGAAHSFYQAHVLVLALGVASLAPLYYLAAPLLGSRVQALAATALFAISPGFLLGLQGILSEAMYLLLSLLFLHYYLRHNLLAGPATVSGLALLLALVILTRSLGYVLVIAVACQAVVAARTRGLRTGLDRLGVAIGGLLVAVLVMALIGPERESHYMGVLLQFIQGEDPTQLGRGWAAVAGQVQSLVDGWRSFFLLYWVGDMGVPSLITLFLLAFAAVGAVMRLLENRLDGWYVLGGVALLLLWPHPGQMVRLLFPLVPLMVVHSIYALSQLVNRVGQSSRTAHASVLVCMIAAAPVLGSHAFIKGRLAIAGELELVPVYEMLRRLDVDRGAWEAQIQNRMLADFANLQATADPTAPLYYVVPEYPALLSDRITRPMAFPADAAVDQIQQSGGGEVLLTRLHPRMNRLGLSGFSRSATLQDRGVRQGCTGLVSRQEPVSCLYTLPPAGAAED